MSAPKDSKGNTDSVQTKDLSAGVAKAPETTVAGRSQRILAHVEGEEMEQWIGLSAFGHTEAGQDKDQVKDSRQLISSADSAGPEVTFPSLRPNSFNEYIGQERIKDNLRIACQASTRRGEALDHVLLHGPPGLGKTSLAKIVATELGVGFRATSGPVIERPGDLAAILTSLEAHEVLFIDEIHRLSRVVEEVLYPAMEDFEIDIMIGHGPAAKSIKIELKPFTLIGATTRTGLLTSPLRDRFGMVLRLGFYTGDELTEIVKRSARIMGVQVDVDAAAELGRRSRGTPRIVNRLLKRVRDYAQERANGIVTMKVAQEALAMLEIDHAGLDMMDRSILELIIDRFNGGPVGIETIAASLGEDRDTLEDVYEPYLVQEGFLARTRRGREVTERGFSHVGRSLTAARTRQGSFSFEQDSQENKSQDQD